MGRAQRAARATAPLIVLAARKGAEPLKSKTASADSRCVPGNEPLARRKPSYTGPSTGRHWFGAGR